MSLRNEGKKKSSDDLTQNVSVAFQALGGVKASHYQHSWVELQLQLDLAI